VLVLMFDRTYMERFWPQLEAWLACMRGSSKGMLSTPEEQLRCTVTCLRETPVWFAHALKDRWLHCDANRAHRTLSEPWVAVTNQSDKEVQLHKIWHMDYMVRRLASGQGLTEARLITAAAPLATEAAGSPAAEKAPVPLADKVRRIKHELALEEELPMAIAIKRANEMMDIAPVGGLPAQADTLLAALGT